MCSRIHPSADRDASTGSLRDARRRAVQRRTLRVVILSQILGGAGLAAGVTVGALLAEEMLGTDRAAGLPVAVFTVGSALAAFLVGRMTQRRGRRLGLGTGFVVGAAGAAGVVLAAALDSIPLLFAALFVYGAGTTSNLQARYAGTDLAPPERRGTAISLAMVFTTFGAVAGPNLIEPMGSLAESLGLTPLAGPFMLAGTAYLAAGVAILALMRPDPFLLARELELTEPADIETVEPVDARLSGPVKAGAAVMILTQITMVAIMTMTPIHMKAHGHGLGDVGLVISLHIAAMFLPSLVTGRLVDRVGRAPMALAAGATLLAAGLVTAAVPGDSMPLMILGLVLLGLGWNFGLISGSALVVDGTVPADRARTQGLIDVGIALAGAGGGAASGLIVSIAGFATLSLIGGALSLLLIPFLPLARDGKRPVR